jgi:integration host factor subunit alpha
MVGLGVSLDEPTTDSATLTKAEIAQRVHEALGVSINEASGLLDDLIETVKETLANGDGQLKVSGFGTFQVRAKNARMGRNPRTRQDILIGQHRVLVFRPSNVLKAALNRSSER